MVLAAGVARFFAALEEGARHAAKMAAFDARYAALTSGATAPETSAAYTGLAPVEAWAALWHRLNDEEAARTALDAQLLHVNQEQDDADGALRAAIHEARIYRLAYVVLLAGIIVPLVAMLYELFNL